MPLKKQFPTILLKIIIYIYTTINNKSPELLVVLFCHRQIILKIPMINSCCFFI
ncbi:Uncharacterised protein [Escherichia coli]|uniref:Uncharacterized protein n=1 Tax=Escherichia coli TaxID=562 RepID=A0A377JXS4_ECOLX|nr:Uncharacterised protein [Escherichia coli]